MSAPLNEIRRGDLYALLSVCTDSDLDPLVKRLTGNLNNALKSSNAYKRHHPRHSRYYRKIGDELRSYGGNTFRNLMRGEGPPYADIVVDVCKKLGVPYQHGDTLQNERNLLNIYLERQWKALSADERDQVLEEALRLGTKDVAGAGAMVKEGTKLLLPRIVLGPAAWGATAFSLAEPAYRVTVPCVLHLAYLRERYLENAANTAPPAGSGTGTTMGVPVASEHPAALIVATEDVPALTIAPIQEPKIEQWRPVESADDGISRLNLLLQAVPGVATAAEMASGQYMEVVINGPMLKAKGKEGYRLITLIDGKPSHGTVLEPSRLSDIVNASALWQVASVAVAQKHLADIGQKLTEIKQTVDCIQRFQTNERRSVLKGSIRYFDQIAPSVLSGELSEAIRHQLEAHEAALLKVQDHLLEDIRHESEKIIQVRDSDMFGSKGMQEAIAQHQQLLDDLYQQFLLSIRARACGWQLLTLFPGEERLKANRKRDIQETLGMLTESSELLVNTDTFVRRKVRELSSLWNTTLTLNQRKLTLLEWNDALVAQVATCRRGIEDDVRAAEAVMTELGGPVAMTLRIEQGRIAAVSPALQPEAVAVSRARVEAAEGLA